MNTRTFCKRKFLGATASAGLALIARPMIGRADAKEVLIAEPVHGTGYLPLYIGMAKNLFENIIDREIPANFVHEDEQCVVIKDINPGAPFHLLVIPRKPIPRLIDATAEDQAVSDGGETFPLHPADPRALEGLGRRLHDLALADGHEDVAHALTYAFGEATCAEGILGHLRGPDLMPVLLNAADRPLVLGSRPTPYPGADGCPALLEPLT